MSLKIYEGTELQIKYLRKQFTDKSITVSMTKGIIKVIKKVNIFEIDEMAEIDFNEKTIRVYDRVITERIKSFAKQFKYRSLTKDYRN